MRYFRILCTVCAVVGFTLRIAPAAQADTNFYTTLDTTYTVNAQGNTAVDHVIKLTNKTPTLYAKQYALKISSPSISKVVVKNNGQVIPAEVVTANNLTSIGITFPDQIVGESKSRTLEITYQNPDSSLISGKVLEVMVPKLASADEYNEYRVTLITPAQYGHPTRTTPAVGSTTDLNGVVVSTFTPQNGESVNALFGSSQIFKMNFTYHLQNTGPNAGLAQIALPPDTAYQKVQYQLLDPQPQTIESDADGNWIATYELPAQSTVTVQASAHAQLTLTPNTVRDAPTNLNDLVKSQQYWETGDSSITNVAQQYRTPKDIYNFVVNDLTYDYTKLNGEVKRLGAKQALANPKQANCQEFTDVFIALARANKIPSRRLTGYAHTDNSVLRPLGLVQDVLHAWPEYYDAQKQTWVDVDPTWGNTTGGINYFDQFDLNHVVFAINGDSSTTPFPAGSYKLADSATKDLDVSFDNTFAPQTPQFTVSTQPQTILGIAVPGFQKIVLTNVTGQAWYNMTITVQPDDPTVSLSQTQAHIDSILPFQTITLPFTGYADQAALSVTTPVQVLISYVDDQNQTSTVNQLQPYRVSFEAGGQGLKILTQPFVLPALGAISLISALIAGGLLVYRRK